MRGIFSGAMAPADDEVRDDFEHATPSSTRAPLTPNPMYLVLLTPHLFSASLFRCPEIILDYASVAGAEHRYSPPERPCLHERRNIENFDHVTCKSQRIASRFGICLQRYPCSSR